ncbi:protein RoBo-1-like [Tamandua tetradactyla]|uniref:protein RoBo-1-like n=1 Tax=Tamandua tetradactyla TaxID=48850 RepID=UPI004053A052
MSLFSTLKSLLIICVLASFAFSTVENYKCASCFATLCTADRQRTCETSQGCFNRKQELKLPGQHSVIIPEKGCSLSECVSLAFSASLGTNRTFKYESRCCQGEQCNKEDFQVSPKSSVPNGIRCPACYVEDDISCDPVLLNCTGAETKCVEVFGTAYPGVTIYAKGCATENACNFRNISITGTTKIRTSCKNLSNGSSPVSPMISPILISFFLLKVLLSSLRHC